VKEAKPEATVGGAKKQKKRKETQYGVPHTIEQRDTLQALHPLLRWRLNKSSLAVIAGRLSQCLAPTAEERCHHYVHHRPENWNPSDSSDCDVPPSGRHHKKPAVNPKSETFGKFNSDHRSHRFRTHDLLGSPTTLGATQGLTVKFVAWIPFTGCPFGSAGIKVELPEDTPFCGTWSRLEPRVDRVCSLGELVARGTGMVPSTSSPTGWC